jgi:hypothetical protein
LGLKFNADILVSDIDVTDCIEDNKTVDKILNFFLESLKETCRVQEGRYHLFHPTSIFWIRK